MTFQQTLQQSRQRSKKIEPCIQNHHFYHLKNVESIRTRDSNTSPSYDTRKLAISTTLRRIRCGSYFQRDGNVHTSLTGPEARMGTPEGSS